MGIYFVTIPKVLAAISARAADLGLVSSGSASSDRSSAGLSGSPSDGT
jgi:hypothetical protein